MAINMIIDQQIIRRDLINAINHIGIKSKVISTHTGIGQSEISRFKNCRADLSIRQLDILSKYLNQFKSLV